MTCQACGQQKYTHHSADAPHAGVMTGTPCAGYVPAHACGNCGGDVEEHDPHEPHARHLNGAEVCDGVEYPKGWDQENPPAEFEGGGGSSGGGGASGGW